MGCESEDWGASQEESIICKSAGQEGTVVIPDLEAGQQGTGKKWEKYERPNPKGPHII